MFSPTASGGKLVSVMKRIRGRTIDAMFLDRLSVWGDFDARSLGKR
jgi:hypothetical protein